MAGGAASAFASSRSTGSLRFVEACAGADVKALDKDGWTALILASMNNHEAVVRLLIDKGADVGADVKAEDKDGSMALVK